MGNIDPANAAASVKGQVYFALCVNGTTTDYALSLPPQPTRYEYKLLVAEHICAVLLPLLQAASASISTASRNASVFFMVFRPFGN